MRQTGGPWQVYRLPDLAPVQTGTARLPRLDRLIGLDLETDQLFALTLRDELLAVDLLGGRIDTVATHVANAVLGPDGTLYAVDRAHRVTTLKRRVRRVWPDSLPAVPRELFDGLRVGVGRKARIQRLKGAAQPAGENDLMLALATLGAFLAERLVVEIRVGPAQTDEEINRRLFNEQQFAIRDCDVANAALWAHAMGLSGSGIGDTSNTPEMSLGRRKSRVIRRLAFVFLSFSDML